MIESELLERQSLVGRCKDQIALQVEQIEVRDLDDKQRVDQYFDKLVKVVEDARQIEHQKRIDLFETQRSKFES